MSKLHIFAEYLIFLKKISFNKLYPQSVLKHSVDHFQGIRMKNYVFFLNAFFPKYVQKTNFYPSIMSTISSKTFSGSFSRYWNENLFLFFNAFFCQNMFKKVVSIHQFMSTISSKTFSGSFSRYWNDNLFFFKKKHAFFSFFKIEICASMCNILQFRNGKTILN